MSRSHLTDEELAALDLSHLATERNNAHDNDSLCGRLRAYEREDEKHLRNVFGYWHMVEKRMAREMLIAQGHDPEDMGFCFKVTHLLEVNHSKDITYREISARFVARSAAAAAEKPDDPEFTKEELEYLAEIFAEANHPLAQSICLKAREMLK